jgi:hypothetical protein
VTSHVTTFLVDLEKERKAVNRASGPQLHSERARQSLRALAERYFGEIRPLVSTDDSSAEHLRAVDASMQDLIALSHRRGSLQKYKDLLRAVKRHLIHLDTRLASAPTQTAARSRTDVDTRILTTLRALLPSSALSYEQALLDLEQEERLSWRGPATDLRESLRETLDHLAPDEDVTSAPGYKKAPDTNGPTMKQKVRFILRNRGVSGSSASTTEDATAAIDEAIGSFVRSVYTRSSVSTHTPTDRGEVVRVRDLVRVVLAELLEIRT